MNRARLTLSTFLFFSAIAVSRADERSIAVVLASNLKPYQEALAGIKNELGGNVPIFILSEGEPKIPKDTQVIVAIGGKAAIYPYYPDKARVVYCLAPGLKIDPEGPHKPIKVHTSAAMELVVSEFKKIQPSMKRLGIPWVSDSITDYVAAKDAIASKFGVEIVSVRLKSADDLPGALRDLKRRVDAVWVAPDPAMISAGSLSIFKSFSWANAIPAYGPIDGLAEQGLVASVSTPFPEVGRVAAKAAKQIRNGREPAGALYPEKVVTAINLSAAREVKIVIPSESLRTANRTIP